MLNKIRAIGDYIKKNNVGGELKDRFVNVLEGYKSKIASGGRSGIGATGPQATSSSPLHKTAMSAIKKYTNKNPIKTDIGKNNKRIMNQRNEEDNRPDYSRQALTNF